jgi:hypothetical protein
MSEEGRVRVPHHRADRNAHREPPKRPRCPELCVGVPDTRKYGHRRFEQVAEGVAPLLLVDVEQLRSRGVARVRRVNLIARHVEQKPGIDRASAEIAAAG